MKTVYVFEAYSPRYDDEVTGVEKVYVDAISREDAKEILKIRGYFGIEDCGHISVICD